jgi:hypothetical protein
MTLNQIRTIALIAPLCCFTSCAAIFTGTNSEVGFQSQPAGGSIMIGEDTFLIPYTTKIAKDTSAVTFTHPNYESVEVELDRGFNAGMLLMDILFTPGFGLSGVLIDAGTSAFYELPSNVSYDFENSRILAGGVRAKEEKSEGEAVVASAKVEG